MKRFQFSSPEFLSKWKAPSDFAITDGILRKPTENVPTLRHNDHLPILSEHFLSADDVTKRLSLSN